MAKQDTFKVSTRNHDGFEIATERKPETLEEFESLNLVSKYPQDVIDLAWQNLVIKMQAGARSRLDQGEAAVQEYCDNYTYGARTGGGSRKATVSKEQVAELGFTEEQLAALRLAGVKVEGMEESDEEEADEE